MKKCSVTEDIRIVKGRIEDYRRLSRYHYRDARLGPFAEIFAMKFVSTRWGICSKSPFAVIVYAMPSIGLELRNKATDNFFVGLDKAARMLLINKNIRCISRVIVEPRLRSLGLASHLVQQTMPKMNVPVIEALAVMGLVNPFFEKAGMSCYKAPPPSRCVQLIEAFSIIGIEAGQLLDAQSVQQRIERLSKTEAEFIESQIQDFLQSYGKRRLMSPGLERTRYVLTKLTVRPAYYIWFNKAVPLKT
ncbi:MAG: hypothetical protein JXB29_12920 [Sedimentisphaerales bacterium]|nr:hypothetical protein [Sedimentisphaerales bacterium]